MSLIALLILISQPEESKFVCPTELPSGAIKAKHRSGNISPEGDHPSVNIPSPTVKVINVELCIEVGPDGRVPTCKAHSSSNYFNELSCKLVKRRFRYFPAVNADKLPITSFVADKVRWESVYIPVNRDGK